MAFHREEEFKLCGGLPPISPGAGEGDGRSKGGGVHQPTQETQKCPGNIVHKSKSIINPLTLEVEGYPLRAEDLDLGVQMGEQLYQQL